MKYKNINVDEVLIEFQNCLKVIKDKYVTLVFPIHTKMTKDKPICALKFHYIFDKNEFYFISYEKTQDCAYHQHVWSSYKSEDKLKKNEIVLNVSNIIDDSNTIVYEDIIEPHELALQNLIL